MERNTFLHPWEIQTQMSKYKYSAPFEVVPYGGAFFSSLVVTISSTNSAVLTNTNDYIQRNLCSLIFIWFVFVKTLSSLPTSCERRGGWLLCLICPPFWELSKNICVCNWWNIEQWSLNSWRILWPPVIRNGLLRTWNDFKRSTVFTDRLSQASFLYV